MFLCQCLFKLLWKECDSDLMQQDYSQKENEIVLFHIRCSIYTGEHIWLSATVKTERRHSLRKLHKANLARELKPSKTRFESSKEGNFLLKIHGIWHPFPLKYLGKMKVKLKLQVAQSCLTVCDPMDYTVHGILQASILEWVAFPFSGGSSQLRYRTQISYIAGGFFTTWATREGQECWSG